MYFGCDSSYKCTLKMSGINKFTDNYADNSGGGIMWDTVEPTFINDVSYKDNWAFLYGNDIACFS